MKVDIRATDGRELSRLFRDFKQAVQRALRDENLNARDGRVEANIEVIGDRPAGKLESHSHLLQALAAVDEFLGITTRFQCSSTDANIPLSLGHDAVAVGGGGRGGGIHTLQEWFDPVNRELGLRRLLLLVLVLAGIPHA
jgi:di/tripeptidase